MAVWDLKSIMACLLAGSCASTGDDNLGPQIDIQSVQPAAGPSTGGVTVTITGKNFPRDAVVSVNDVLASEIRVISDHQISATLPASTGKVGKAAVTVSVTDGRSASRSDIFSYYYGALSFSMQPSLATGIGPKSVVLRDFNSDKRIDVVTANSGEKSFSLFLGLAGGGFASESKVLVSSKLSALDSADIDGDGLPDLIATSDVDNQVLTLLNHGGTTPFTNYTTAAVGQGPIALSLGDLNADGKLDVAVANKTSNNVSVLLNQGGGAFGAANNIAGPTQPFGIAIGDVDGDEIPDLALTGYQANVAFVLLNSGGGKFLPGQSFSVGDSPNGISLVDLNQDGKLDISTVSQSTAGVSVLLGQTAATFATARSYPNGAASAAAIARDINGDGNLDLIVSNGSNHSISVLPGLGDGSLAAAASIPLSFAPAALDVADIDGDGRLDMVVLSPSAGEAIVLLNRSR